MGLWLLPFSWLYGFGMLCRNHAFDLGMLRTEDVGVPVISVGNITMGGTGKTPLVEYIAARCAVRGRNVAVVSRGYKRKSRGTVIVSDGKQLRVGAAQGGDEPVQIARKLPAVRVVVGEKRVDAARTAVGALGVDTIVLDDGFQHRYLHRGLDIVVIDSRKDLFHVPMIPAGGRREPISSIKRAHLVAFSRAEDVERDGSWMNDITFGLPAIRYRYTVEYIQRAMESSKSFPRDFSGMKFFLFSGIGDHEEFVRQMAREGIVVVDDIAFPDHHTYSGDDLRDLTQKVKASGADALLTTEKDMVRLMGDRSEFDKFCRSIPLFHVCVAIDIFSGKEIVDSMIDDCLRRNVS